MAYIYPLNNPGGVHLTVFDFTHLSHTPTYNQKLPCDHNFSINLFNNKIFLLPTLLKIKCCNIPLISDGDLPVFLSTTSSNIPLV